ncbi:MAG: septum formation initiator family protein [Deltaproteobacteria bacterium]|nr:septum formation initiator family protein [Deltaproteobacteria bacterium]
MLLHREGGDAVPPRSTSGGGQGIAGGRKTFLYGSAIFGLAVISIVLFSHKGVYNIYRLGQERTRLERENARLAEENARLARTIDRLQNDPEMIQDLIRRELNYVKNNEVIIQLPDETGMRPVAGAAPPPPAKAPMNPAGPPLKSKKASSKPHNSP